MNYYYVIPQIFSTFSFLKKSFHSCHSAVSYAYVSPNGCLSNMLCESSSDGGCTTTQTNPFQYLIILNSNSPLPLCLTWALFLFLRPLLLLQCTKDVEWGFLLSACLKKTIVSPIYFHLTNTAAINLSCIRRLLRWIGLLLPVNVGRVWRTTNSKWGKKLDPTVLAQPRLTVFSLVQLLVSSAESLLCL